MKMLSWPCLLGLILCFQLNTIQAQEASPLDSLFEILKLNDAKLFNGAFVDCDSTVFEKYIHEDLEFYHDQSGITTGRQTLQKQFQSICASPSTVRRGLIEGSMEVFPLYDRGALYGAIQTGDHQFFESIGKAPERLTSTARFTHLWILDGDDWKIKRILSYDHR